MKKLLFITCISVTALGNLNSQTVSQARAAGVGANVSVRGVVVNGSELGSIRYIQDVTGGIGAYGTNLSTLNKGDSVVVSGPLTEYYNLYEINPPTFNLIGAGHVPAPMIITPNAFAEIHEGRILKFQGCAFGSTGTFPATATNYTVICNGQSLTVRTNTALNGVTIPTGTVDIIGVGSQFCGPNGSSGCTTGYQLLPRTATDFAAPVASGLKEIANYVSVSVFPNPASKVISFTLNNNERAHLAVITDVTGKTVYSSKETSSTIDVSELPKGFYNLLVYTDKGNCQTKFIIE